MEKSYKPAAIEKTWYARWEEAGYFAPSGHGEPYSIMIPPPNVTGTLHMGHAFQDTIMDALTRYHRMLGYNTLWQPGTDHAGIATQMVVERQIESAGQDRLGLGREAFVQKVWDWKHQSGATISQQLRRMGSSVDWSRERFTMDEKLSRAVIEVFVQLHDEGLIFRGKRLVNWDPVLHTALSDLEVLSKEEQGHLWHFRYPLTSGDGHVVVATTRPETMLGDTAVAVHPEDTRYRSLIGQTVELPLTGRQIPVIADDYVDPEFGSGCVKITPAHDFNDYEVGQRHEMEVINLFTIDAVMNENAPAAYQGMDRFAARDKIVADLEAADLMVKIEPHLYKRPYGDRSGVVIEPYLTDQWFVRAEPLAKPAIEAVKDGRIRFIPENWSKTYFNWMEDIQDWCISRQIWWGHRIPAWYDNEGTYYVAADIDEVRSKYGLGDDVELTQDEDVLDTWFSSALWPYSTLGWPDLDDAALKTFYPTSVLVTGFDIIFFWVARMIMFGLKFMGDVPFREVCIHGLIRDREGQKMSKSKGNVLDPLDLIDGVDLETLVSKRTQGVMQDHLAPRIEKLTRENLPNGIEKYGADAMRFSFAALATTGRDIRFELGRVEGNKNFCNKLWNAARYVLMNTESIGDGDVEFSAADRWIRSRFGETAAAMHEHFATYRLDLAAQVIYEFTWHEFCDWYLELSKPVLQSDGAGDALQRGTRQTLIEILESILRLLHPLIPFVTEEIWQQVAPRARIDGETIMMRPYPEASDFAADDDAVADIEWVKQFILGIRQIRGEMDISPGKPLPVVLQGASERDQQRSEAHALLLQRVGRVESVTVLADGEEPQASATALHGDMRLLVAMKGLIDVDAERTRLLKQQDKVRADLARTAGKLGNENFVNNAPADVVTQEKQRAIDFEKTIAQLAEQLEKLTELD